jgi:hypothetical protein
MRLWRVLALLAPVSAIAQLLELPAPSPTDLQASYCVAVLKKMVESSDQALMNQDVMRPLSAEQAAGLRAMANQTRAIHTRVLRYLAPRLSHIDLDGIALAMRQGEDDFAQTRANWQACTARCRLGAPPQCLPDCVNQWKASRIARCTDDGYLPY